MPTPRKPPVTEHGNDTLELERLEQPKGVWTLEVGTPAATRQVALSPGSSITLGSSSRAAVRIDDPAVSAVHCRLSLERHGMFVRDLGSTNGVYIAGARVGEALLTSTDSAFVIGRTSIALRAGEPSLGGATACRVPGLVGDSEPMQRLCRELLEVAKSRAAVLLWGASGTGKDVAARALHQLSARAGAYVPINAAAFPDSLADSELFGHCRGAFTGAVVSRAGAFEQANAGTLFLDEVAELSPAVQVRLLRVVEDGRVRPLGGTRDTPVNVRVVSATWADLVERVEHGLFRADLYHRLATVVIELPRLRERKSDIPALSKVLLKRFEGELGSRQVSPAAMARLVAHDWPGNVRELASALYRAALCCRSGSIDACHLRLGGAVRKRRAANALKPSEARELYELHGRNTSAAARAARVPRSTFRGWLERGL